MICLGISGQMPLGINPILIQSRLLPRHIPECFRPFIHRVSIVLAVHWYQSVPLQFITVETNNIESFTTC